MSKENTLGVALVKRACPICAHVEDAEIVLNRVLTSFRAKEVEALHGQVIGYTEKPCKECQKLMEQGFLLIQVDESKTDDHSNPWRTGKQCVIKREVAERIFINVDLSKRVAFMPINAWEKLKLP